MPAARRALLIAGPTASGKTRLAVALAQRVDGEIINADSMQVYADLKILSARPGEDERGGVPHHLFGHVDGAETYSVGRWLKDALAAMADIRARNRTPIIAGGTGLYFRALTEGLAETPDPGEAARASARALLSDQGVEALHARATALDPAATARVEPTDTQRLLRIVEVAEGTGRPLSDLQTRTRPALSADEWRGAVLAPDRDALNHRIAARAANMISAGAVREVKALRARALAADRPVLKALGVATLGRLIDGDMTEDESIEALTIETRQYAKRQRTWFRNQIPDWPKVEPLEPGADETLYAALLGGAE